MLILFDLLRAMMSFDLSSRLVVLGYSYLGCHLSVLLDIDLVIGL